MAEQTSSVPFIPPELRRHIASYCDRATLASLCKVDVMWAAESQLLLLASLVLRVFYKEDATNAVDACLAALCASELKAASVTALAIYYPVDDPRARELLWRTYGVVPRLRNLVDVRLHMGFNDWDAVRGLYSVLCSPTIRLRTLVIPHAGVSDPELALLHAWQPALELCVVRCLASFEALCEPGVLPAACLVVAYEGQSLPGDGNTMLTVDRLTVETVERLWRVFDECEAEYPWETVPVPSPCGVRAHPDEDERFHTVDGSSDLDALQEAPCDDLDGEDHPARELVHPVAPRRTAWDVPLAAGDVPEMQEDPWADDLDGEEHPARELVDHVAPRRTGWDVQLAAGAVPDFPTVLLRRRPTMPMRHRPREWTSYNQSFRSTLLAGRMRHPNRLDVDTVELLLDEVPHADVMRQVMEVCPNAHTISLAFRITDELAYAVNPSAIAAAIRPCRTNLRTLNLKALHRDGLEVRGHAITNAREFLQAVLDVGCYEIQKMTFWQRAKCTKDPSSGLWQTVAFS